MIEKEIEEIYEAVKTFQKDLKKVGEDLAECHAHGTFFENEYVKGFEERQKYLILAINALKYKREHLRVKGDSANRLTMRNSMERAILRTEYQCERCDVSYWSLGDITDRLAFLEESRPVEIAKMEKALEFARFNRSQIRSGYFKAETAREISTTAASMLTGIVTILLGELEETEK